MTLYAASSAVLAYWGGSRLLGGGSAWLLLGSLALGGGAALLAGRRSAAPQQQLAWDGASWSVGAQAERRVGQAALMLDLGAWMLVRFVPAGLPGSSLASWRPAARWLAFSYGGEARAAWHALRVALYAQPPAPGSAVAPRAPGSG